MNSLKVEERSDSWKERQQRDEEHRPDGGDGADDDRVDGVVRDRLLHARIPGDLEDPERLEQPPVVPPRQNAEERPDAQRAEADAPDVPAKGRIRYEETREANSSVHRFPSCVRLRHPPGRCPAPARRARAGLHNAVSAGGDFRLSACALAAGDLPFRPNGKRPPGAPGGLNQDA
jgi:hypothetical protein